MKLIKDLKFGYNDAENYKTLENKEFFTKIFVKNKFLEDLTRNDKYFLIGEKGTGKTAYAVFLSNQDYNGIKSELKYIRETDYVKFISLKKLNHLELSDYKSIWIVILLLLVANSITEKDLDGTRLNRRKRIKAIKKAINEYYAYAFSPEIMSALTMVENSKIAAEMFYKYLKASGEESRTISFQETSFQVNLLYLERQFKVALNNLKLNNNHFLFIDGIDIRPGHILYEDYLNCIKGLANATWSLNSDYFCSIKDSPGRLKVVLLMRPDIFNSLHLQNSTNKLFDNSVFLDWRTTYPLYKQSELFNVADKILRIQQDSTYDIGESWEYYLPWKSKSSSLSRSYDDSFIDILRHSYSRPRDVITILNFLKKIHECNNGNGLKFQSKDFFCDEFLNCYSQYLMGNVQDQLSFYYTRSEYDTFLSFFNFLDGRAEFSYDFYKEAYENFTLYILEKRDDIPEFVETDEKFLQFLYDTNVIYYVEKTELEPLYRWCYRERSISNISPKIKLGVDYKIHKGLLKELNLGFQTMLS